MTGSTGRPAYEPLNLARLGGLMVGADDSLRWRLIAEFLEDYRHESAGARLGLLEVEPVPKRAQLILEDLFSGG
jgi:hypothetical protein